MIVVADTSPLNYLILIGEIDVLHKLYGRVLIPPAVESELLQPGAPQSVMEWMRSRPEWLEVRSPMEECTLPLDPGEAAAIALALELHADQIIVDEDLGRHEAARLGLGVIGTIGVLRDGHRNGHLDISAAVARLNATNFHVSPSVIARVMKGLV